MAHNLPKKLNSHLFIDEVESGLVDQTNIKTLFTDPQDSIVTPVEHLSERNDVSSLTLEDSFILSGLELIVALEESRPISFQDVRNLGTSREDEADASLKEDSLDDCDHLCSVSGEI